MHKDIYEDITNAMNEKTYQINEHSAFMDIKILCLQNVKFPKKTVNSTQ